MSIHYSSLSNSICQVLLIYNVLIINTTRKQNVKGNVIVITCLLSKAAFPFSVVQFNGLVELQFEYQRLGMANSLGCVAPLSIGANLYH